MKSEARQRFDIAMSNDSARRTLAEFLLERYTETVESLMSCSRETFEAQKGRAIELKELISLITK